MKKTFIAAAVGVAMAAPLSAFAAATLYGQAHGSVNFIERTVTDADPEGEIAISSNSSRIGVKGSENVGDMDVVYQMEWHVSLSDNHGSSKDLGARNRFVGLKSADFGTVVIGRMDTPSKKLGRSIDLFHSTQLGENRNVTGLHGGDARRDNAIQWNSNNMSGLKVAVQYSADALTGVGGFTEAELASIDDFDDLSALIFKGTGSRADDNDYDAFSMSGTYTTGDIMVGAAWDSLSVGEAGDLTLYRLAGSYTMGDIKLVGFYESVDLDDLHEAGGSDMSLVTNATTFGLGASMKNGPTTFKIAYYDMANAAGIDSPDEDTDGSLISVGVDHALSASTMIYATAADGDNFVSPAGFGYDDKVASDTSGVSFGIRTKF